MSVLPLEPTAEVPGNPDLVVYIGSGQSCGALTVTAKNAAGSSVTVTGVQAADTVMIGDTSFDMRMAANAGVRGLGVVWGYHPREELMASGAHAVADTYAHLAELMLDQAR